MDTAPLWAEIDLTAIAHNVRELRRITRPQARLMAVVKANGYGHGAVEVSRCALQNGASLLGVARIEEGKSERWITPTKALEQELSPAAYRRYQACTAALEPAALQAAYRASWAWGIEMMDRLGRRYKLVWPDKVRQRISERQD